MKTSPVKLLVAYVIALLALVACSRQSSRTFAVAGPQWAAGLPRGNLVKVEVIDRTAVRVIDDVFWNGSRIVSAGAIVPTAGHDLLQRSSDASDATALRNPRTGQAAYLRI